MRKDDWDAAQLECRRLQEQGNVIFYQPYLPKDKDSRKRHFVVIIQDEWMRNVRKKFQMEIRGLLILLFQQINMAFICMPQLSQTKRENEFIYSICYAQGM